MARNRYLPFGYRLENGETVICAPEAECIERAYAAYADSASYAAISDTLQAIRSCTATSAEMITPQSSWRTRPR